MKKKIKAPIYMGVVGAGQMGAGIAQTAAQKGIGVVIYDSFSNQVDKAKEGIEKNLDYMIKKGKMSEEERKVFRNHILYAKDMNSLSKTLFVVEAVTEDADVKKEVFQNLDKIISKNFDNYILASNTSSIPITKLASYTKNPKNFIGMHFMNPVPLMKGVELINGLYTSEETYKTTYRLAQKMGKEIITSADKAGFVINRILMPQLNESFYVVEEGTASIEDVDKGAVTCLNHPMGPLTLSDHIGLDTVKYILEVMEEDFGDRLMRQEPQSEA